MAAHCVYPRHRNDPEVICASSDCCIPVNPCKLDVADRVSVVYFDNALMEKIENKTRCVSHTHTERVT